MASMTHRRRAQDLLDEAQREGYYLPSSCRDALEIEAHNDRCMEFLDRDRERKGLSEAQGEAGRWLAG